MSLEWQSCKEPKMTHYILSVEDLDDQLWRAIQLDFKSQMVNHGLSSESHLMAVSIIPDIGGLMLFPQAKTASEVDFPTAFTCDLMVRAWQDRYRQLADNESLTDLMFDELLDAWVKQVMMKLVKPNAQSEFFMTAMQFFDQDLNHLSL